MIQTTIDTRQLKQWLRDYPKQVKLAQAVALTKMAQDAQEAVVKQLPDKFNLYGKNAWWSKNRPTGIKIKRATKSKLESTVFTGPGQHWAARQEYGKTKTSNTGKNLIIPIYQKAGDKVIKKDKKYRGFERETWRKAKGYSTAKSKYGSTNRAVKGNYPFVITNNEGTMFIKRTKKDRFTPVFAAQKSASGPKKRWGFRSTAKKAGLKNAQRHFFEAMRRATVTANVPSGLRLGKK